MEWIDLYDENRTPLGRVHPRSKPVEPGAFYVVVGIWIFNDRHEILLTRRHPDKKYAPNLWENTGGHVRAGENSADAAVRELYEETGVRADREELHFLGSVKVPPFFGDNFILYRNLLLSSIVLQSRETSGVQWVTLDRFNEMAAKGELAPSVVEHLKPHRSAWENALTAGRMDRVVPAP